MKNSAPFVIIIAASLLSCKKEEPAPAKPVVPFTQLATPQGTKGVTTNQSLTNQNTLYQQDGVKKFQNPQGQTTATTAVATAKGMNPPHGQPGHKCEIPVGAPLNSVPKSNVVTSTQVTPSSNVVVTQKANSTVTPKGMNPPHGQPGHKCDIPVGAPLNSAKAATPAVPALLAAPTETNTTTTVTKSDQ
jgi:hypothetical protein